MTQTVVDMFQESFWADSFWNSEDTTDTYVMYRGDLCWSLDHAAEGCNL